MGFFVWYEGLARAGIARGGQLQLAQPLLTILWSGIVLGELIDGTTALAAVLVLICVVLTQRTRVRQAAAPLPEVAGYDTVPQDGRKSVTSS
jgi:drug/metabolite transporter (DMT)-like permease